MTRDELIEELRSLAERCAHAPCRHEERSREWAEDLEERASRIAADPTHVTPQSAISVCASACAPKRLRDDERWSTAIPRLLESGLQSCRIEAWRLALGLLSDCDRELSESRNTRRHWAGLILLATQIEEISGDALRLLARGIDDEHVSAGLLRLADRELTTGRHNPTTPGGTP